jgi:ferric-dicitrate binding protein FerR (iron transport regulator)
MDKELIKKYFNNNCTGEELSSVLIWFEKSARTTEGKDLLLRIWEEMPDDQRYLNTDFDLILDKIHHRVNLAQSRDLLETSGQDPVKYKRREYLKRIIIKAAAVLLLPVLGFGLYMTSRLYSARHGQIYDYQAYNEIFSSADAITKVTLPDGSNVWLNHSSSLRYPAVFKGRSRDVELKGEGFFEVVRNSKVPFIVNAGELKIVALGTTFNVMAYPEENKIETSLIDGNVEIQKQGEGRASETIYKMKPTDLTIYNKENQEVTAKTISDNRYFSWKEGKLIFTNEPLEEVVKKLSRWFNVEIHMKDPELNGITLTATFVHETLPQVIELLTFVSPVSYTITDRKEDPDGTFSKRKVILSFRKF